MSFAPAVIVVGVGPVLRKAMAWSPLARGRVQRDVVPAVESSIEEVEFGVGGWEGEGICQTRTGETPRGSWFRAMMAGLD